MASRGDGRVRPGQRLDQAFSARAWNRSQDAADIVLRERQGFAAGPLTYPHSPYISMPGRNISVADVPRWGALQIASLGTIPNSTGTGGTSQFEQTPVLELNTPPLNSGLAEFAVALEPVASGELGRFAVDGVVQAKIRRNSLGDRFVRLRDGSTSLQSSSYGNGVIIWAESGIGDDIWALIRLGGFIGGTAMIRFSGPWPLNISKPVTIVDSNDEISVSNQFASISASCGERFGAAARHGNTWYLIAAQFE